MVLYYYKSVNSFIYWFCTTTKAGIVLFIGFVLIQKQEKFSPTTDYLIFDVRF